MMVVSNSFSSLSFNGKYSIVPASFTGTILDYFKKEFNISSNNSHIFKKQFYVLRDGYASSWNSPFIVGSVVSVVPRILGGKGGFGSMLRTIGAQIEKTTNFEACRDLNGRRMRDINNEKKLKEWVESSLARDEAKKRRREERKARRLAALDTTRHIFSDPKYDQQKQQIMSNLDESIAKGLSIDILKSQSKKKLKRKSSSHDHKKISSIKKACLWTGLDPDFIADDDLSSDDSDNSEDNSSSSETSDSDNVNSSNAKSSSTYRQTVTSTKVEIEFMNGPSTSQRFISSVSVNKSDNEDSSSDDDDDDGESDIDSDDSGGSVPDDFFAFSSSKNLESSRRDSGRRKRRARSTSPLRKQGRRRKVGFRRRFRRGDAV